MKKINVMILALSMAFVACDQTEKETPAEEMRENPLLSEWTTPFGVPPFDLIEDGDYLPAFENAFNEHNAEIDAIITNAESPSFTNTIVALEESGATLSKIANVFYSVESANTNDSLKEIGKVLAPMMSTHYDNINLNSDLFARVKSVYENKESFNLDSEDSMLLEESYKGFVRSGANVEGEAKEKLKVINSRLAELSQTFGDNLLNETNSFELHLDNEADVADLPAALVSAAADESKARGNESGWSFTTQRPSINPFLQSSANRDHRKILFDAYAMRGNNNNSDDNKDVLAEMVSLRTQRADLLGFESHADYVLSNSMAENPTNVYDFMDKLWGPALDMAKAERAALTESMNADKVEGKLMGSDWRYYVEKVRAERYNFDEEEMRPYFEFTAVRDGAFMLATKLFGLQFKELKDMPVWHEDQQVFEVLEADGTHLGVLYMDFFARESKRGGAWMNELRMQSNVNGMVTPIVTNNFNFPKPVEGGSSLLSFSEAQTLFHEFGHALHGLFSNVRYGSLSGTNVPRDFVEFPSQVMENWMSEPEVLKLYAKHYETGEVIPDEMIKKMNEANAFNVGFSTVEAMAAAYLDMAWHTLKDSEKRDVVAFENEEMARLELIEEIIPRYRSTYFAHIFSGGYSSGYYSYMWSEVLDADAFQAFKETSIFDQETAARYRTMLSLGGSKPGMELYEGFRGRAPEIEALLEKKGFK